ncbi:RF13 [Retroperitoneal fibromatosis-associated herpesvirus]|uniref:RF13 n=1 Tax=Retroperitoneal fibromatosis-associated herpesvirus TaxID=111469 RepID=U5NM89_9GAMA|nr:RF13 [Retroperitoneal fibromatosis-associated herpesvirus]AGY30758.1 RF13 [Retroperitoneal fibromatosis-associated herpesvirus]
MATVELLQELGEYLDLDNREAVLFLCGMFIPQPTVGQFVGALVARKESGHLTLPMLAEAVMRAGRRDLVRRLLFLEPGFVEHQTQHTASYFSAFRRAMVQVDRGLGEREFRNLVFLSRNALGARHVPGSFLHWVHMMERLDLLGPGDVDMLVSLLGSISRPDLQALTNAALVRPGASRISPVAGPLCPTCRAPVSRPMFPGPTGVPCDERSPAPQSASESQTREPASRPGSPTNTSQTLETEPETHPRAEINSPSRTLTPDTDAPAS